jgi:hypothetical protein
MNGVCAAGMCVNTLDAPRTCLATTCLDPTLCDKCDGTIYGSGHDGLLACATSSYGDGTHLDTKIAVKPSYALCGEPYYAYLGLTFPCADPKVISWVETQPGPRFQFLLEPTLDPNVCKLSIYAPFPGAQFTAVPHLLISVATPSGPYPRAELVIALVGVNDPNNPAYTCLGTNEQLEITNNLQSCVQ